MFRFKYVVRDFEQMVDDWGAILNTKANQHLLTIPSSIGSGTVYGKIINDAMSFLVMNIRFNTDVILDREALDETSILLYFLQVDVSGRYHIATDLDKVEYKGDRKRRSIFLSSTNYPLEITYSKGSFIQIIGVYFKSSLVRKFVKKDVFHHLRQYSQTRLKDHDKRPISDEEKKLIQEIFETNISDEFGKLILYNRILLLVEKSLNRFLMSELPPSKTKRLKEKDMDGLKEVEKMLSKNQLEKFPNIQELSRIALMSSTKLKKRFKEVYGMKLYEFYNYNRLSQAKKSIEIGQTSVKEAAYQIGFTNLSNFSKAFKKEFGVLPSHIRQ